MSGGTNGQSITVKTQEDNTNVTGLTRTSLLCSKRWIFIDSSTPSVLAGTAISSTELIFKG